jgi:two-component system response regulator AtoC
VIAATNRDPLLAVKSGLLREDLYYRLNVFNITVPPLRERIEDIPILAKYFLQKRGCEITQDAIKMLQSYPWPGNVRELENVLERASIVCDQKKIALKDLPYDIQASNPSDRHANFQGNLSIPTAVEQLEKQMIIQALETTSGNKSKAAKLLEISERSLWNKLSQYELK